MKIRADEELSSLLYLQMTYCEGTWLPLWLTSRFHSIKILFLLKNVLSTSGLCLRSLDSSVGIATGYGLDDIGFGVWVPEGSRIFSSPRRPDWLWGSTQPPIQCVPWALSPEVKQQGCEADHSPPSCAEVKSMWIYTSTPPYAFMAWCLIC
jgi:hypothetical protein